MPGTPEPIAGAGAAWIPPGGSVIVSDAPTIPEKPFETSSYTSVRENTELTDASVVSVCVLPAMLPDCVPVVASCVPSP
jgi:hypothetical protein